MEAEEAAARRGSRRRNRLVSRACCVEVRGRRAGTFVLQGHYSQSASVSKRAAIAGSSPLAHCDVVVGWLVQCSVVEALQPGSLVVARHILLFVVSWIAWC